MEISCIYPYDVNNLARVCSDEGWFLIDKEEKQVGEKYPYIEEWGEGYYRVEKGAKKNIMRPDGSLVLKEWHNNVWKVNNGFIIFSNTIRKSKTNPTTRYTYGVAHVNGDVIFPMIFDSVEWTKNNDLIYAEIDEKPYLIGLDGSIYDPMRGHLPNKRELDDIQIFEKILNWTLPGLQFFYRDTDATIDIENTYHVGDNIRAGFYIDVTTKLLRPVHKTRFLIASAHTAMMCRVKELCEKNPDLERWGLCTLHFNSYFKVLDVYNKRGVTQIFLLHIPETALHGFSNSILDINFVDENIPNAKKLVEMARQSLDEKIEMDVHPRSLDEELVERMHHPVGLDNDYHLFPMEKMNESLNEEIADFSRFIHHLADDADIEMFEEIDNFPYEGIEKSICKGCIYAKGIQGNGEGCGRLFTKSFRLKYIKGRCEYKKSDLSEPSEFERKNKEEKKLAKEAVEKNCDTYALNMLRAFVDEKLNGDIRRLKYFDFNTLKNDKKYGNENGLTIKGIDSMIMKSILSLAFSDAWHDLTYGSIDHNKYSADTINVTSTIFGISFEDYYKALETFDAPQSLRDNVIRFGKTVFTIGNTIVLPSGWVVLRNSKPFGRGYMDIFLREVHKMMVGEKGFNRKSFDVLGLKVKEIDAFRTEENFQKIVRGLMLDDFLDEEGKPRQVFQGLFSWERGIKRETYLKAANEFLDFCEPFIDKRADRIIEKLESILNCH